MNLLGFLSLVIAPIYLMLGPVIIPRLLKRTDAWAVRLARIGLGTFFVACAGTHIIIGYLAFAGQLEGSTTGHHLYLAVAQSVGGMVFLVVALSGDRTK